MTTLFVIHENIEAKIRITEMIYASIRHFANMFGDHQVEARGEYERMLRKYTSVSNTIDIYQLGSQTYLVEYWDCTDDVFNSKTNVYSDSDFIVSSDMSLTNDDLLELKNIYYDNYYTCVKFKYSTPSVRHRGRGRKDISSQFTQFTIMSNIVDTLDSFVEYMSEFIDVYASELASVGMKSVDNNTIRRLHSKYCKVYTEQQLKEELYDVCDCGNRMIIQSNTSEMICVKCGKITMLLGSVTEESQLFAQEGNRVAHGSYDPTRHCKFWIERIQAKESTVIPDEYIERLRSSIRRDKLTNLKNITVQQFRMYLKQNDLTKLNDHIPLIKKIITGYIPPQLTHREQQLLFIYFDKATKTYDIIKPSNKKNSLYYPFLIYKIIDLIIQDEEKKKGLLGCIHLQSYETLIDNDRIWHSICKHNRCFEYRPTNKTEFVS